MHNDWHIYRKETVRSLRGYGYSLLVSFVFYLVALPRLHGWQSHLRFLKISFIYGTVIFAWIWSLYSIQWAILVHQHVKDQRPLKISWPTHILLSFSGTVFGVLCAMFLESQVTGAAFSMTQLWETILIGLLIATFFQFYYAYKHSAQENLELKTAKAEGELHVLRNQMQPHFLFNSLNSLVALIELNPTSAGEATQKLADLYRLILESSKTQLSPLRQELKIAELYLDMEKIRFGDRLQVSITPLARGMENVEVPSLILQTLVENAVKHGISKSLDGGVVRILIEKKSDGLQIEVLNSGAQELIVSSQGTGLKNTRERLDFIFGKQHGFDLQQSAEGLTSASFLVPGV